MGPVLASPPPPEPVLLTALLGAALCVLPIGRTTLANLLLARTLALLVRSLIPAVRAIQIDPPPPSASNDLSAPFPVDAPAL